jgi:hypothetical protein
MSVAAGYMATLSLRNGGTPYDVPPLDPALIAYFDAGQVAGTTAAATQTSKTG